MTQPSDAAKKKAMEDAAKAAAEELKKLDPKAVKLLSDFWKRHYVLTGHKRLAHVLMGYKAKKSK